MRSGQRQSRLRGENLSRTYTRAFCQEIVFFGIASAFDFRVLGRSGRTPEGPSRTGHDKRITRVAGLAPSWACGAEGRRPADGRRPVRGMGGEMSGSHPLARPCRRHGQFCLAHEVAGVEHLIHCAGPNCGIPSARSTLLLGAIALDVRRALDCARRLEEPSQPDHVCKKEDRRPGIHIGPQKHTNE